MLTVNLATALAKAGHATVATDLDLGGANLHTMLGMPNKYPGIGDFLKGGRSGLQDLLVPTAYPNFRFLPGDGRTPFMANIPFDQRLALMKELYRLPARFLLLDLGAGSSFNTLNLFGMTRRAAIVTTFDTPAVMNFLMFLRNFMFRLITGLIKPQNRKLFDHLLAAFRQPTNAAPLKVDDLLNMIAKQDEGLAAKVRRTCSEFEPRIIFNMGDRPEDLQLWPKLQKIMRQNLSLDGACFGFVYFDNKARRMTQQKGILLERHPESPAARCIADLAGRIIEYWDQPAAFSSEKILIENLRRRKLSGGAD
jgi:flagellar biosynthesis protein FlhG